MKLDGFTPMSPILTDRLPAGDDWGYQLKWDGFRIIAAVEQGSVQLFSKRMASKNRQYPELEQALAELPGTMVLDGEAVVLDPATGRPSFQRMQLRDKQTDARRIRLLAGKHPVSYMLFDLLMLGELDLRPLPFAERQRALAQLASGWGPPFYVPDVYPDGEALWREVVAGGWEGVVAKKLSGAYLAGKDHRDWYKRRSILRMEAEAVGILVKEGRISSLAMRRDGRYFGRVSSGLNGRAKELLGRLAADGCPTDYFGKLPDGLRGSGIRWLSEPLPLTVVGRETTEAGMLRHPKLIAMGGRAL